MISFLLGLFLFIASAQAVLLEGPVHVSYADGTCSCTEGQIDTGLGMSLRVGDLKLRPGATVHRPPPPTEEPPPDVPPPDPPPEEPDPVWVTNVDFFGTEATNSRKQKYNIALEMIERTMNQGGNDDDNEFRADVLAYDSPYTTGRFVAASGSGPINKTNAEIWQHNWDGNETRPNASAVDNEADVEIEFYYANNSTIGYTYATSRRVWVNTKFFDGYKPSSVASNFFHEWNHKLGYGHESGSSNYRPYTVPYGMGYLMRTHCQLLDDEYGY